MVQILAEVAKTQVRPLRAEASKGFLVNVFFQELVSPKVQANAV